MDATEKFVLNRFTSIKTPAHTITITNAAGPLVKTAQPINAAAIMIVLKLFFVSEKSEVKYMPVKMKKLNHGSIIPDLKYT